MLSQTKKLGPIYLIQNCDEIHVHNALFLTNIHSVLHYFNLEQIQFYIHGLDSMGGAQDLGLWIGNTGKGAEAHTMWQLKEKAAIGQHIS